MTADSKPTDLDRDKARHLFNAVRASSPGTDESLAALEAIEAALALARSSSAAVVEAAIQWAGATPQLARESIDLFLALREAGLVDENGKRIGAPR